jgi:hypothetical protein
MVIAAASSRDRQRNQLVIVHLIGDNQLPLDGRDGVVMV